MGDVVAHRLEMWVGQQMSDVVLAPGEIIVDAEHVVALGQQALAQMRAEKTGAAGDENTFGDDAHRTIFRSGHASTRNSGRTIRGGRPTLT